MILKPLAKIEPEILLQMTMMDQELFSTPWTPVQWQNLNGCEDYFAIYQRKGEVMVGFALFHFSTLEGLVHLLKIATSTFYRKQGWAKGLLLKAMNEFQKQNIDRCYLEVSTENKDAIKLYETVGFQRLNRIPQFYSDGSDAFTMELKLPLNI